MSDILGRIQPIFRDVFDAPDLNILRASSAENVEGWDSLAQINLVTAIEKEFNIRFTLGELEELNNVGEMVDLIGRKTLQR
jgi:acyl carrier protein